MITARHSDITTLAVDAIVNAANEQLAPGAGVCGAIFAAAGLDLVAACGAIGHCPTGSAVITPGFDLPAKHVIHAVGPVWHSGTAGEAEFLASAYRTSMRLAAEHQLRSIAFPAISTGIYGYPLDLATEIAVRTVTEMLPLSQRERGPGGEVSAPVGEGGIEVIFCCFDDRTLAAYRLAGVKISD